MKTSKSGSYLLLLLISFFSLVGCHENKKDIKDSRTLQFKKLDKKVVPVEVMRFFSTNQTKMIIDLDDDHIFQQSITYKTPVHSIGTNGFSATESYYSMQIDHKIYVIEPAFYKAPLVIYKSSLFVNKSNLISGNVISPEDLNIYQAQL